MPGVRRQVLDDRDREPERCEALRSGRAVLARQGHHRCGKACQGRPVTDGDLAILAQKVEEALRQTGQSTFEANDIGLAILDPLRELDEIAYLRFASVYRAFETLEDFEDAIADLRRDRDATQE